eukprot:1415941-Prymnesium_polylepis.1
MLPGSGCSVLTPTGAGEKAAPAASPYSSAARLEQDRWQACGTLGARDTAAAVATARQGNLRQQFCSIRPRPQRASADRGSCGVDARLRGAVHACADA